MDNAIYATLTRQSGLMAEMRVVANNIANANTTGFRREGVIFAEHLSALDRSGDTLSMAHARGRTLDLDQGVLTQTNGSYDLAIEGEGFFLVETPDGNRLTRAGAFLPSAEGELMTAEGFRLLDDAAVALAGVVRDVAGLPATLKWPNDVLVETGSGFRKICGVLASLVVHDGSAPALVLGAGLNVAVAPEGAASVRGEGSEASRGDLLVEIAERFTALYRLFAESPESLTGPGELRAAVEQLLSTLGRRVRAELPGGQAALEGVAVGLDERGALLIDHDGGRTAVSAADVVHLRPIEEGDRA